MTTPRVRSSASVRWAFSVAMVTRGLGASVGGAYHSGLSMRIVSPSSQPTASVPSKAGAKPSISW